MGAYQGYPKEAQEDELNILVMTAMELSTVALKSGVGNGIINCEYFDREGYDVRIEQGID